MISTQVPTTQPQVFEEATTEAEVGDYFKLPFQPCVKVIARIDLGDYITFIVQAGNNHPEQWDMLKPEVALSEQERDRIQAEEIAGKAVDSEAAIHQLTTPSQEKLVACPYCSDGCSYCGYSSLKPEPQPDPLGLIPQPSPDEFRYQLHLPNIYSVYLMGECLGFIQRVRNPNCILENSEDTWLWLASEQTFTNPTDAADALLIVTVTMPAAA
ncbi:MAG: hypothetical protein F6K31_15810 [Symploca sp. SIO2G7]|nr:hypothetical protein [Symploca sp. SIO2G7]